jgi:hypothetical protein
MPVDCATGFTQYSAPSVPSGSFNKQADGTYTRVTYDLELADASTPAVCGCGQKATFNFGYGTTSEGQISITPVGIGGGVAAGEVGYTEVSVDVGGDDFEYMGYKVVVTEKTESGITATTSGGFAGSGFFSRLKAIVAILIDGPAALVPTITYSAPAKTETKSIVAGWKICRKPCG